MAAAARLEDADRQLEAERAMNQALERGWEEKEAGVAAERAAEQAAVAAEVEVAQTQAREQASVAEQISEQLLAPASLFVVCFLCMLSLLSLV